MKMRHGQAAFKTGVIDIGSNTIHLDLFRVNGGGETRFLEGKGQFNKLGVYLSKDGLIPASKIKESVDLICQLNAFARKRGAREVLIFATSILRKAKNRDRFIQAVLSKTGQKIDVVSAVRESGYLERIARAKCKLNRKNVLFVDIGGGSTELVLLNREKTLFRRSYAYGLSYVKGKFHVSEPFGDFLEARLQSFFQARLEPFLRGVSGLKIHKVIGFSSVAKSFALIRYAAIQRPEDFCGKIVTARDLALFQKTLRQGGLLDRLPQERRELVYIGTFFFQRLFALTGLTQLEVSPYSIREGYLIEYLGVQGENIRGKT